MERSTVLPVVLAVAACVAQARAATELFDDFNRTGALNGSSPSVNPHSATWTSTSTFFTTDGSKVFADFTFLQSAYLPLPVPISSGNIYTLSDTTIINPNSPDDVSFMMLGFFDGTPTWDASTTIDGGTAIAIGPRNNRSAVATFLDGHLHPTDVFSPDGTNGVTLGIKLYETAPAVWVADIVELAPTAQVLTAAPTPVNIGPIATIGLISSSSRPPFTDNFRFEVTRPGDVNSDGVVDIFDVNLVSAHWGESGPTGDANGDGAVDIFDINLISSKWSASGGSTAVPEPSSVSLATLGLVSLALLVHRRHSR